MNDDNGRPLGRGHGFMLVKEGPTVWRIGDMSSGPLLPPPPPPPPEHQRLTEEELTARLTEEAHDEWLAIKACTSSPLQAKLFALWHMMGEGLLEETDALLALGQIVKDGLPKELWVVRCPACQRDYGAQVRVHQGATVEVVCPNCVREGRTE